MQRNKIILGIDEVGRGPWAGPLVIGACILPHPYPNWVENLTDSKKLTAKKREELNKIILKNAPVATTGWVSAEELDKIGLSNALKLATRRAVEQVQKQKAPFTEIIIDGTVNFLKGTKLENYVTVLKKADFLIKEVSAASIIAKVARDNYMVKIAKKYPGYGFEKHVGYGTAAHKAALLDLGPCPEHRKSFKPVREVVQFCAAGYPEPAGEAKRANPVKTGVSDAACSTKIGHFAEGIVTDFLASQGHHIIARNHKTKFYEIDIISEKWNDIFFTEVKYRKDHCHGSPLEMVTKKKQDQIRFAAESYLKYSKSTKTPHLAVAAVSGSDYKLESWFTLD